ncbi:hypothetical protein [Botrimarina mediterranea]|uniref:hypothetical protein n=1 Tax=Botrimarina mediterranea TaxID=2528022 RepID=UPI0011A3BB4C|nr:hypothetical protein [Botrimarina mediterranea]
MRTLGWGVWNGEFPRVVERFRKSCGESRPLIEAPHLLCTPGDLQDFEAWCIMGVLQLWDLHLLNLGNHESAYFSHDEWCATTWQPAAN